MKIFRSKGGVGVVLGIVGMVLYLVALLLSWYVVTGNIQTTAFETVGETDLVLIDGVNGLRVNTLQSDRGLAQLFGLGIPFAIILLSSVVLNVLDLIGVEKAKSLSRTFIMSGITSLIPVIIILVFIIQLAGLITPFVNAMGGGVTIPPQIEEMAKRMSSSPIKGEYSDTLDHYGNIHTSWGLGIGSYLFIAAAITKIAGGIITKKRAWFIDAMPAHENNTIQASQKKIDGVHLKAGSVSHRKHRKVISPRRGREVILRRKKG